jgi:hypothetical protein
VKESDARQEIDYGNGEIPRVIMKKTLTRSRIAVHLVRPGLARAGNRLPTERLRESTNPAPVTAQKGAQHGPLPSHRHTTGGANVGASRSTFSRALPPHPPKDERGTLDRVRR